MPRHRLFPEVAGRWGDGTVADTSVHPPRVERLHYVIEGWEGDDLVESFPCYIVTDRLAAAITDEALTGVRLADVQVTLDEQFAQMMPKSAKAVPTDWRWLLPTGDGEDFAADADGVLSVSDAALAVLRRFSVASCEIKEV